MREGDWRRLVVPASLAYGDEGLLRNARGAVLVRPNEDVYVDLLMSKWRAPSTRGDPRPTRFATSSTRARGRAVDAASCDELLRPRGKAGQRPAFAHDATQKSLVCKRGSP